MLGQLPRRIIFSKWDYKRYEFLKSNRIKYKTPLGEKCHDGLKQGIFNKWAEEKN